MVSKKDENMDRSLLSSKANATSGNIRNRMTGTSRGEGCASHSLKKFLKRKRLTLEIDEVMDGEVLILRSRKKWKQHIEQTHPEASNFSETKDNFSFLKDGFRTRDRPLPANTQGTLRMCGELKDDTNELEILIKRRKRRWDAVDGEELGLEIFIQRKLPKLGEPSRKSVGPNEQPTAKKRKWFVIGGDDFDAKDPVYRKKFKRETPNGGALVKFLNPTVAQFLTACQGIEHRRLSHFFRLLWGFSRFRPLDVLEAIFNARLVRCTISRWGDGSLTYQIPFVEVTSRGSANILDC